MQILTNPKFDFLGKKKYFVTASLLVVALSITSLAIRGIPLGIDFRGGADVQLKFRETPPTQQIRSGLEAAGFHGVSLQAFGAAADNEVLIQIDAHARGSATEEPKEQEDLAADVLRAIRTPEDTAAAQGKVDLNAAGASEIKRNLVSALGPGREDEAERAALAIKRYRKEHGELIADVAMVKALPEITPAVAGWLGASAIAGRFSIVSIDYVGPAVGADLRSKARWAVVMSLVVMLMYIAFRFKAWSYGVSAIVTLAYDVMVTLGFISFFQKEFDLTVLAAVLTIVGYSLNDTIVIFDRVRENLRLRRSTNIEKTFNDSINETLSRTILTSFLVWIVLVSIWVFGGSRLEPFSFALLVGSISGTYSTIYISSPVVVWWMRWIAERKKAAVRA
ncbi:MAG: protein translocase subunit SecF [Acidobacteria bacterium]|nr:protein translocase subunit SecF [Acidobacteriota bacterium]